MASINVHITLAGVISDEALHKCIACVKDLESKHEGKISSSILSFFPTQWEQYLKKL